MAVPINGLIMVELFAEKRIGFLLGSASHHAYFQTSSPPRKYNIIKIRAIFVGKYLFLKSKY